MATAPEPMLAGSHSLAEHRGLRWPGARSAQAAKRRAAFFATAESGLKRRQPPTGSTFVLSGLDVMGDGIKLCCMRGCRDLHS